MASDDIQGQVTDSNGNAVTNAVVALWSQSNPNNVVTTQADASGNYLFEDHPDGDGTSQNWHLAAYDPSDGTRQFPSLHSVSAQLLPAIPDSVVSRPDDNFTSNLTDAFGLVINPNSDFDRFAVRVSTNTSKHTRLRVYDYSSSSYVFFEDVSSTVAGDTITIDQPIDTGDDYAVELDAEGSTWDVGNNPDENNYPYPGEDIDIVARSKNAIKQTTESVTSINDIGNPDNVLG
jgi:hypothetical protein